MKNSRRWGMANSSRGSRGDLLLGFGEQRFERLAEGELHRELGAPPLVVT